MIEKIIFNLLAFSLFIVLFFKLVRKNDTSYLYILGIEFLGICINFVELIFNIHLNIFFRILTYILSIIVPALVILVEYYKKIHFSEILHSILATIIMKCGNSQEARKQLIVLTNKYPNSYLGHKKLADIYQKEGKNLEAIGEYEKAIDINEQDYTSYYQVGLLLQALQKREEASILLQEVLRKKPDYYEASMLLGDVLYEQENFKDAISVYTDALKYRPGDYELYYNLGMVHTRVNDFQKAKEYYETAAQLNSLLYHAKYNLGQISLIYGDLEEAEKYFMECMQGKEVEAGSYFYLSQIAMIKANTEKAINYANVAVEEDESMYKRFEQEPIFLPILSKINKPTSGERKISQLTKKEKATQLHLDRTFIVVNKLNNNDIRMMKNRKEKQVETKIEIEDKQREN